jgi:hypothetical protein
MTRIFVPKDAAALAVGADKVAARIAAEAHARGLPVEIIRTGSRGMFFLEPLIEVETAQGRIGYGPVSASGIWAVDRRRAFAPDRKAGGPSVSGRPDTPHLRPLRHRRSALAFRLRRG